MSDNTETTQTDLMRAGRLSRWTTLEHVASQLLDVPASGIDAWARTTGGVVAFLLVLQIMTGTLLAFVYVPSAESAHATVAYTEKVLDGGSWIRALHFYCSQLLPLALVLHLVQMLWRGVYIRKPIRWLACLLLLALVMANGATGYSLPWDARAYFSTNVAVGIAGGLPFVGAHARSWLAGGADISTLTISRFYALHVLVVPALILTVIFARFALLREPTMVSVVDENDSKEDLRLWLPAQLIRHAFVLALIFICLSFYALKFPAPLGPPAEVAEPGYLPRPGAQFLWLFQLLKYFPPLVASLVAFLLPTFIIGGLAALPFVRSGKASARADRNLRVFGWGIITLSALLVVSLTAIAIAGDRSDSRVREQLARQSQQESEFRNTPFVPRPSVSVNSTGSAGHKSNEAVNASQTASVTSAPPPSYTQNCAKCHGQHGEGHSIFPALTGVSTRPRRSLEDLVAIMNNPRSYGLESRMPSFATKLSEAEKQSIAEWIATLN